MYPWLLVACCGVSLTRFALATSSVRSSPTVDLSDGSGNTPAINRPNIVLILTDDQDLKLGSLDLMPNLQSLLVQNGLFFNNHYCSTALCCPSRATLWTGKYAHNTNVTSIENYLPGGAWKQIQRLGWYKNHLGVWAQEAGYNTYYAGKIFNGINVNNYCDPECLQGWNKSDLLVEPRLSSYYNSTFVRQTNGAYRKPGKIYGYSTDIVAAQALSYIDDAVAANKPFFAVAAPIAPHIALPATYREAGKGHNSSNYPYPLPKKEYEDLYPGLQIPRTPNFNPDNRTGVAGTWNLDKLSEGNIGFLDNYYRIRQQTLKSVDDLVRDIVTHLDNKGILDNTYIIYTSDNGFHLGNHRLQPGKLQCFEEDINVPFIIRGPGVAKNQTTDLVTGHVDIAPTILSLINGSAGHRYGLDGTAITFPLESQGDFDRNAASRGDFVHVEFWGPFHQEGMFGYLGVDYQTNFQTHKALRIIGGGVNLMYSVFCQNGQHELYDMTWDPYQLTNLHPDAPVDPQSNITTNAYHSGADTILGRPTAQVLSRLDAIVLVEKTCSGEVCRHPWKQLHPDGSVNSLMEALHPSLDKYYHNSYTIAKVGWQECYKGYSIKSSSTLYSYANEAPNWLDLQIMQRVHTGAAAGAAFEISVLKIAILALVWLAMAIIWFT